MTYDWPLRVYIWPFVCDKLDGNAYLNYTKQVYVFYYNCFSNEVNTALWILVHKDCCELLENIWSTYSHGSTCTVEASQAKLHKTL